MELNKEKLFELALNISNPLYIKEIYFDKEKEELHIYIDFKKGSTFKCPVCGKEGNKVHDTKNKKWRHLNFFENKTFIHFRTPRIICETDGVKQVIIPWAGKGEFTLLFDSMIMELAKYMPIKQIAANVGENDTKIWRIIGGYVTTAQAISSFDNLRKVGVDETSSKKGHNYITTFVDMNEKKVIYATEGKDSTTIEKFKNELPCHYASHLDINQFSIDMSPAFKKGVDDNFPWAVITFDKFHVIKLLNEVIDQVRRSEQMDFIDLKCTRYLWLKNQDKLTDKELEKVEKLSNRNLKTSKAYRMKLILQEIYETSIDKNDAAIKLNKLYKWMIRSRLEPIKKFAKTLKKNWSGIINFFETRLTNGVLEGINSQIQLAKARARGYRNINAI